jgi:hypothetical protein
MYIEFSVRHLIKSIILLMVFGHRCQSIQISIDARGLRCFWLEILLLHSYM